MPMMWPPSFLQVIRREDFDVHQYPGMYLTFNFRPCFLNEISLELAV
jgi:hypothetical protein